MARNYYVDDETNRDWLKVMLEIQRAQGKKKRGFFMKLKDMLIKAFSSKAKTYQVQPFHSEFGKADAGEVWSFTPQDGNDILDKGGWELYKQAHLITDTSEGSVPENKGAYTYPVAKLVDEQLTYFLKAAQTVYSGLRGGARAADLPKDVEEQVLATVKKIYAEYGRDTEAMEVKAAAVPPHTEQGAFAFKAQDGSNWWFQFTSNAFEDREREIFTTKALEDFVERHCNDDVKGEFWYRHIPGTKFGTVKWQAMVGRFLAQAGPFDDTPTGQIFEEFFSQYPDGHPEIAPYGWGTSHGYEYDQDDRADNVYEWLEIEESTVLPAHVAANPWNPAPQIINRSKAMNEQEKKDLMKIGGEKLVQLVTTRAESETKKLETSGVAYKAMPGMVEKLQAVADMAQDENVRAALLMLIDEYQAGEEKESGYMMEETEVEEEEMKALSREEVGEALVSLTKQLRAEITAGQQETGEALQASLKELLDTALKPLAEKINALEKADGEKIAQKAAQTPAASLSNLVKSAMEAPETLTGKPEGPVETKGIPQDNGLPPIFRLITGQ